MFADDVENYTSDVLDCIPDVSEGSKNGSTYGIASAHGRFAKSDAIRTLIDQKMCWKSKAARNAKMDHHMLARVVVSLSAVTVSVLFSVFHVPARIQVSSYILAIIIILVTDPVEMLGRFLADISRYIIAFLLSFVFILSVSPEWNWSVFLAMIIFACIGGLMIALKNDSWLAQTNWKMSEQVQKVLRIDPDQMCCKSWQAHGKRETRTMLFELGYAADDNLLDIFHRPVYLMGYLHGAGKVKEYDSLKRECESNLRLAQQYKIKYDELKNSCEDLQENVRMLEVDKSNHQFEDHAWKKKWEEEKKRAEQLEAANEELLEAVKDAEESKDEVKETTPIIPQGIPEEPEQESLEDKVKRALRMGLSFAQAGEYAGCSKSKAYSLGKEYKKELQSQGYL